MPLEVTGLNRNYVKIVYWTRCTVDGFVTCNVLILSIDHIVFCSKQDAVCFEPGLHYEDIHTDIRLKCVESALPGSKLVS